MMKEIHNVRQIPGETKRRWFTSSDMDLIVWTNETNIPSGFQLCYDKGAHERALTWSQQYGFSHMAVDDGEQSMDIGYKATPVLTSCGAADMRMIHHLFLKHAGTLPADIVKFVENKFDLKNRTNK